MDGLFEFACCIQVPRVNGHGQLLRGRKGLAQQMFGEESFVEGHDLELQPLRIRFQYKLMSESSLSERLRPMYLQVCR